MLGSRRRGHATRATNQYETPQLRLRKSLLDRAVEWNEEDASHAWSLRGVTSAKTKEDILAHPVFATAKRAHIDSLVEYFVREPAQVRLMLDAGAITLRGFLVALRARYDPGDRANWPTLGLIQKFVAERRLASARRLADLVARFREIGYVASASAPSDRRVKILTPTEKLLAHDAEHLDLYQRFLHHLYPGRGYDRLAREDRRFYFAFRKASLPRSIRP